MMDEKTVLSVRPVIPASLFYLERPRIEALLDRAMETPIVLVIGGAGYGKTQAVYSYLDKKKIRTIWIQFSERDNLCDRFWENLTRSVSMISGNAAQKLTKLGFPATDRQFEQYLSVPLETVDPGVKYVIVYDDIHLVHDKAVLRFLERLITTPFLNITSVLISRKELSFNLMRFYAKGLLARINEADLRFRKDEMEAYFSAQEISAPPEILDSVYRDTEGWAFAIQLAGLYLKNLSIEGYGAHILHPNIYQLIDSEIMAQISRELRKFLIKLALVGDASPELVRELARLHLRKRGRGGKTKTGDDEKKVESLIRQIEGIGSFIRFDAYRNVFSIHRLFRDYLGESFNELTEEEKKELYLAAADWCAAHNLKMDAIIYYEKAGDYGKLIAQINTLSLMVPIKTVKLLMEVLERIPKEVYPKYTSAYLVQAGFLLSLEKVNKARKKIEAIIKSYEALPESKSVCYVLFNCYNSLGSISRLMAPVSGDYSFSSYFEKSHYYQTKWGGAVEWPKTVMILGTYACRIGSADPADMERYFAALDATVPHVAASMNGCMYGMDELSRGELEFFRMNLETAESFLRGAVAKARERHQYDIEMRSYFYLMRIGIFQGDIDLIHECHECIAAFLENEQFINRYIYYDIYRSWFYAHLGDREKISGWLKKEPEDPKLNGAIDGLELLIKIKNYMREGNYPGAIFAMRQTRSNAGIFIMGKVELHVMEAVCRYQMGDKNAAYEALEKTRLLAVPNGLFMPFAEMGKDIRALATQALKDDEAAIPKDFLEKIRNMSSVYAKKFFHIAKYFSAKPDHSLFDGPEGLALSRREQDVLAALFQGLTQDEIAISVSRSVNTVKSVVKRIYEKLGAVNRADAIRIAMSRGLLEWEGKKTQKQAGSLRPLLRKTAEKP